MESLTLLSVAASSVTALPTYAEVATTPSLVGTQQGVFLEHQRGAEMIYDYDIKAVGNLTPIGPAKITGNLEDFPGTLDNTPMGTVHLTTSKGTMTLQMSQPSILPAGLPVPNSPNGMVVTYGISNGTGAYENETGSGVVEFTFKAGHSGSDFQTGDLSISFTALPKNSKGHEENKGSVVGGRERGRGSGLVFAAGNQEHSLTPQEMVQP